MKYSIEKEAKELYYITIRYGDLWNWGSQKTFVRIPYKNKKGEWQSKYYCIGRQSAILFETIEEAKAFERKYDTDGYIKPIKLKDGVKLTQITIKGQKCLYWSYTDRYGL